MINKKVARRYTLALYEIGLEMNTLDTLEKDFTSIKKSIENSSDLRLFLSTPIISSHKKESAIKALFEGKVSELTLKFLQLICLKAREKFIYDISADFLNLLDEKRGIVTANIKTAIDIPDAEKNALAGKLEKYSGKKIKAKFTVDSSIKGGFIAQIDDTIIDASIKRQLELLFEQFKQGSFRTN